jgi:hypothetical protein
VAGRCRPRVQVQAENRHLRHGENASPCESYQDGGMNKSSYYTYSQSSANDSAKTATYSVLEGKEWESTLQVQYRMEFPVKQVVTCYDSEAQLERCCAMFVRATYGGRTRANVNKLRLRPSPIDTETNTTSRHSTTNHNEESPSPCL